MNLLQKITLRRRIAASRTKLYRMAVAWCYDRTLADDLAQECLARALQCMHQVKDSERLQCWLYRILSNCWHDHLRRQRPTDELDEETDSGCDGPEAGAYQAEVIGHVRRAVAGLPIGQRKVLTLVDLEGLSYAEVAEVLAIPIGTVMSRLSRARDRLQTQLESTFVAPGERGRLWRVK